MEAVWIVAFVLGFAWTVVNAKIASENRVDPSGQTGTLPAGIDRHSAPQFSAQIHDVTPRGSC